MNKLAKIQGALQAENIEAVLVTSEFNRRYVSGFTGTSGVALILPDKAYFVTDFRYTEQAAKQAVGYEVVKHSGPIFETVNALLIQNGVKQLSFEESYVTVAEFKAMGQAFAAELAPIQGFFETMREVKTADEMKEIRVACEIADAAFDHIITFMKAGMKEIEVSNELEFFMRRNGATSSSFDTIVASGVRSALPHGVASDKVIEAGDFVTMDYGCYYNGYCSDMTRTVAIGEPDAKLKEIYQITLDAQLKVIDALKPGITGIEADKIARDHIASFGYGEAFGHSLGHGIGLEIHEGPNLSMKAEKALVAGNVVTDEPGIYLPGIGGVRIEDDLLITENGNEVLIHSPKELIIL
ncbi:aminopeptidase YpdF [Listeria floridensis FSL S10-1187]|uniref:Aminopeptidase YpdF n=1 Tax=Listeria floridensis FSL S10-1187 TaxID=1265817 RepID=A0ABN0RF21_9LIST|nr:Xaa-Pro peptidase family protein [Listeria floridensis]EUJ31781.1 aminopeptidase YpdF [Listeria floridensis FSL S10-1187]